MLVGRQIERHLIAGRVASARLGESAVLLISGEAGIGKSALLAHVAEVVDGMRVHRVVGSEAERDLAFAGLSQLFGPEIDLGGLPEPQAHALGVALARHSGGSVDRFAVGAATLGLLGRLAETSPRAVLIDDAHLLDRPSAEAIAFAVRRLVADQILVVAAVRAGEPSPLLDAGLPVLELTGLDLAAGLELLATELEGVLSDGDAARLISATGGNPLALLELAGRSEAVLGRGPEQPLTVSESLAATFLARTDGLSEQARACLLTAAASGGDRETVTRACVGRGLDPARLVEAADAGLVRLETTRIVFRHPLVRSAVYSAATPAERRATHAALAEASSPHQTDRRAWHLAAAAPDTDEAAAEALVGVSERARERAAYDVVATALERSARLSPGPAARRRRLVAAAEAAWIAGQGQRSRALLDEVGPPPAELVARVGGLAGTIAARAGSLAEAVDRFSLAADQVAIDDPDAAITLLADGMNASFYRADTGWLAEALDRLEGLLPRATTPDAEVLGTLAVGMSRILLGRGGVETLKGAAHDLVETGALQADPMRVTWLVMAELYLRQDGVFRDVVDEAVGAIRAGAVIGTLPYLLFHVARDDATTDRWREAESAYHEAMRLARESGQSTDLAMCLAGLAWLEARQGRRELCREHAAESVELCDRHDIVLGRVWAAWALAELELGAGDATAALPAIEDVCALLSENGIEDVDLHPGAELTETLLRLGREDDAVRTAAEFLRRATSKGQPWALAQAHRACALAAGDDAGFEVALAHHAETRDVFEQARTQLARGASLRRHRRRRDARPALAAAHATFERIGARRWAEQAAAELEATGETVRRRGADVRDALTPQERQIAGLLAAGRTTREAAAGLFLSPKTVEYHLRHVYLKLGISSRADLARVMDSEEPGQE